MLHSTSSAAVAALDLAIDSSGTYLDITYWAAGRIGRAPNLVSGEPDGSLTWVLAGTQPLLDRNGHPGGSASLELTMIESGEPPEAGHDRMREGNRWYDIRWASRPMLADGMLVIRTDRFDLAPCAADVMTQSVFATNPSAYTWHSTTTYVDCVARNRQGATAYVSAFMHGRDVYVDVSVYGRRGMWELWLDGAGFRHGNTFSIALSAWPGSETPTTRGAINLRVDRSPHPVVVETERMRGYRFVMRTRSLEVIGTLRVGAMQFDLRSCDATMFRESIVATAPNGPKSMAATP